MLSGEILPFNERGGYPGFIYAFFPFLFGVYPYTVVTEKQKAAMQEAGVDYVCLSVYEIIDSMVKKLLGHP